ncbi:MAG: flagella basal body P-ring formation protein FlgA, partial [Candidatus Riflebacteria bacterium]|nr:flagella basal body P-ring formation protein FlgA [Candidatus Riflebacteria bacterium]
MLVVFAFPLLASPEAADLPRWPAALKAALHTAVCSRNGYAADNIEITFHKTRVPDRCDHATDFRIEIPEFDDAIGPLTVRAQCDSASLTIATVSVPVRVSIYEKALVTTRRLQRFDVIRPEDIRRERFEVTKMIDWAATDADSVIGRRVLRTISAGQVLDLRALAD